MFILFMKLKGNMQAILTKIVPIFSIIILKTIQNVLFLYLAMNFFMLMYMYVCMWGHRRRLHVLELIYMS